MISRHYQAAPFVSSGNQLEQNRSFSLVLSDIAEVLEDEHVVLVELLDRALQRQSLTRLLQTLHQIGGSGEQHAVAVLDQSVTEGSAEVRLARAARAEQQDRSASIDPSVAGGERSHVGTAQHRHGGKVETVEGLAGW